MNIDQTLLSNEIHTIMPVISSCRYCGATARISNNPSVYQILHCNTCELSFLDVESSELQEYADTVEKEHFGEGFVKNDGTWAKFYDQMNCSRVLETLAPFQKDSAKLLLEVGIGSGRLLQKAAASGWQVCGVDLSPELAENARRLYNVNVFNGTVEDFAQDNQNTYDVVVMKHVLEHIPDLKSALTAIKLLLKSDGILHIQVPNYQSWNAKLSGWTSYQPYHLYYFTRQSLTHVLKDAGFEIIKNTSYEPITGWVNTIAHSLKTPAQANSSNASASNTTASPTGVLRNGAEAVRFLAGVALTPLRLIQGSLGKGEELVVQARKI